MNPNAHKNPSRANDTITAAVEATPGVTVADLTDATGLGKSTISKTLATLEANGAARREPGGRSGSRRLPDRWHPTTPTRAPVTRRPRNTRARDNQASSTSNRLGKGSSAPSSWNTSARTPPASSARPPSESPGAIPRRGRQRTRPTRHHRAGRAHPREAAPLPPRTPHEVATQRHPLCRAHPGAAHRMRSERSSNQ